MMIRYEEGFLIIDPNQTSFPNHLKSCLDLDLVILSEVGCRIESNQYYLSYEALYAIYLNDEKSNLNTKFSDLQQLGLPNFSAAHVNLENKGTLKENNVNYVYEVEVKDAKPHIVSRKGLYIETDHNPVLLEPPVARLLDAIDNHHSKIEKGQFTSAFEHAVSCSTISNLAKLSHSTMRSGSLKNTNLKSFDKLPVKIGFDPAGNVDVNVDFGEGNYFNAEFMRALGEDASEKESYTFKQGTGRQRIYLSARCRNAASRLYKARTSKDLGEITKLAEEVLDLQKSDGDDTAFELIIADYALQVLGFTHEKLKTITQKSVSSESEEVFSGQDKNYILHTKEEGINISVNMDNCSHEYDTIHKQLQSDGSVEIDGQEIPRKIAEQFIENINKYHESLLNKHTADELEESYNKDNSKFILINDIPIHRDLIYNFICKLRHPENELVSHDSRLIRDEIYVGLMGLPPEWDYKKDWSKYPSQIGPHFLMEHQLKGCSQMSWLYEHTPVDENKIHRGMLMADDMGVGKTLQVISFIDRIIKDEKEIKPILIVAPISLIQNAWFKDFTKFAPHLIESKCIKRWDRSIFNNCNTLEQRILSAQEKIPKICRVLIINYEVARLYHKELAAVPFRAVFLDEAQHIKNLSSGVSNALKCYKSDFYCAMTGTPVENSLYDLFSIMEFVQDKRLGEYAEFDRDFCIPLRRADPGTDERENLRTELLTRLGPVWLRRTKEEVLDLCKKHEIDWRETCAEMSDFQKELYHNEISARGISKNILGIVAKLQIISSAPWIFKSDSDLTDLNELIKLCPKLGILIATLREIKSRGEKVLIFSKYKDVTKSLSQIIRNFFNLVPKLYYGELSTSMRQLNINEFEKSPDGVFDVMIINPKIAGFGLTLTNANHVIHYTREWNPALEEQATCRVYRKGQKKEVFVYRPTSVLSLNSSSKIYKDEVEPTMDVYLARLNDMKNAVIDDFTFAAADAEKILKDMITGDSRI